MYKSNRQKLIEELQPYINSIHQGHDLSFKRLIAELELKGFKKDLIKSMVENHEILGNIIIENGNIKGNLIKEKETKEKEADKFFSSINDHE
tara:strand:- start:298 stop:573 length:276 start_codon:yes stop_codon:yes gene_type:complete